jgi:hypothetical protein
MEEFLQGVVYLRWRAIMDARSTLEAMGCPCIIQKLHEELCEKSRTWAYAVLQKLNLKLATPELLETKRSEYGTSALINRWFNQMLPEVQGVNPALIFNFDETMLYSVSNSKIIISGEKKTFRRKAPMGPHITLGLCISPIGVRPPPLIILPVKDLDATFSYFQSVNLVQIACNPSGWMTCEIFVQWANAFCQWLQMYRLSLPEQIRGQTALLYIDNCRSHCSLEAFTSLRMNNVKVISFPPHVTHILQPVDVSCTRALKAELWKNVKYFEKNVEKFIVTTSQSERRRAGLILAAISSVAACNFRICSNGFRKAGIYPFDSREPLVSVYVVAIDADPEENMRQNRPGIFHMGSSVMTSDDFLTRLSSYLEDHRG